MNSTYAGAAGMLVHLNGKIEIISFVPKFLPNLVSTTKRHDDHFTQRRKCHVIIVNRCFYRCRHKMNSSQIIMS